MDIRDYPSNPRKQQVYDSHCLLYKHNSCLGYQATREQTLT